MSSQTSGRIMNCVLWLVLPPVAGPEAAGASAPSVPGDGMVDDDGEEEGDSAPATEDVV